MHCHLEKVQDITGFAAANAKPGQYLWVLTRAHLTSDDEDFNKYITQITNSYLNAININSNTIYQFLVLIHKDLSADIYLNDFSVHMEVMVKRDVNKLEPIMLNDIADIKRLKFPDIQITDTDRVFYCFKVDWKFGLFFDLDRTEKLDIEKMYLEIGALYCRLMFERVYDDVETKPHFTEMINDGWFPFIEIIGGEYQSISDAYKDKFDFSNRIEATVGKFERKRIEKIITKWWKIQVFADKKTILEAGANAFLLGGSDGNINCLKTMITEIEGILRLCYYKEMNKGDKIGVSELLEYLFTKSREKVNVKDSLILPEQFVKYLKDVVFSNFNIETGQVNLSRNSASHGVASSEMYSKPRALQAILILDQIYYYLR